MNPNEKIDVLDLSVRTYNCLMRANIATVGELFETDIEDLRHIRNLGYRCLEEIIEKKELFGLSVDRDRHILETEVPNPNVKKKSADQMFSELGYQKVDEYISGGIRYENKEYGDTVTIMGKTVEFSDTDGSFTFWGGKEEILACAQLIKEMEKANV